MVIQHLTWIQLLPAKLPQNATASCPKSLRTSESTQ